MRTGRPSSTAVSVTVATMAARASSSEVVSMGWEVPAMTTSAEPSGRVVASIRGQSGTVELLMCDSFSRRA